MADELSFEPMLGALLRRPLTLLAAHVAADLASAGFRDLRPAHLAVFQHLGPTGARATDLARRAQMTKQSMGALVDDLQRLGYLERLADPADRRAKLVQRTERGWQVERVARASVQRFEDVWADRMGHDRMRQLRVALEAFADPGPPAASS